MEKQNLLKTKILGVDPAPSPSPTIGGDPEEVLELLKKWDGGNITVTIKNINYSAVVHYSSNVKGFPGLQGEFENGIKVYLYYVSASIATSGFYMCLESTLATDDLFNHEEEEGGE